MALYAHRTNQGKMLSATDRPWLLLLLGDSSPHIVIQKCSQVGVSEIMIAALACLASQRIPGLYVLPTDVWRSTFVANRIDPVFQASKVYAAQVRRDHKSVDSRIMKTIFGVNWKFVGANVVNNFFEFPAGALLIDEYDRCDQDNLVYAYDRLGAAANPFIREFGNPTLTSTRIHAKYEQSDGKRWMLKCPHCNEWQDLNFFVNVVHEAEPGVFAPRVQAETSDPGSDATVICRKCGGALDRLAEGEWVPERPDKSISGYQLSKLFADIHDGRVITEIIAEFQAAQGNATKLQRFYNNILGIPFRAAGNAIDESILSACAISLPKAQEAFPRVAGMDVGDTHTLHIEELRALPSGKTVRVKLVARTVREYQEAADICAAYGVERGVVDAGGEIHPQREFAKANAGWFLCYYGLKDDVVGESRIDYRQHVMRVNRTESLDSSFSEYLRRQVVLPPDWRALDNGNFAPQMCAPQRILDEESNPPRYIWDEGSLPDHHRHADNYCLLAARLLGYGRDAYKGGLVEAGGAVAEEDRPLLAKRGKL